MVWAENIAKQIIARRPDKDEYVCAAGISPSGSIHIGNFRDIATSYFVVQALRGMGRKARLLFSWDEFDRLRKIPVNVASVRGDMEQYVGMPYVDVPNPFGDALGAKTYAGYFEQEFMDSVNAFGIDMDYRYQASMYRSGKYTDMILKAIARRREIYDILSRHRTQPATEAERNEFYPVSIYCAHCGRDTTRIVSISEDNTVAEYECACGHHASFDFKSDFNCKLNWKIDWPMRWMYEGVDFEPGGKDHAAPHGSYDTSKDISREIFGYEPPLFQGYEFIGIRGTTGKMSGSSGLNLTPGALLKIYQPEVILWLYAKTEPMKAFDFCFDDGILRQYGEFDRMLTRYNEGTADDAVKAIMDSCLIRGRNVQPVPMNLLIQIGSVVNFDVPLLEAVLRKNGTPYTYDQFKDRLDRARYWLEVCAPDQVYRLRSVRNWEVYNSLEADQQREIDRLCANLKARDYTLDELNAMIYAIPLDVRQADVGDKEKKKLQTTFFKNVYRLLLGREQGPRLYLFLDTLRKDDYLNLLDFSYPQTQQEIDAELKSNAPDEPEVEEQAVEYGDPDPVQDFKPVISLEQFNAIDLRVCKILKCQEIRKARVNYKLTLFDGKDKRTIVSSLKDYYKPEQLEGRKIIVIANLAPARLTGVKSEGMLLAATNNACGCKVIFVDDSVPEGTMIR
ncbi:MAG TPA: lysine--tRNA ligase [Candidatus Fimadaptatus faecigallinarum]|uniref:Lysine--tRNA ligase n=1 Tax=Candidatus Fimadaptatus faecigallinarum TaxID=2840814 RepID=A0A9D1S4L2_9FIRM|nr:lysine--tRNA ligase [Candidatus Fimadaptatus faecigallinarum]